MLLEAWSELLDVILEFEYDGSTVLPLRTPLGQRNQLTATLQSATRVIACIFARAEIDIAPRGRPRRESGPLVLGYAPFHHPY